MLFKHLPRRAVRAALLWPVALLLALGPAVASEQSAARAPAPVWVDWTPPPGLNPARMPAVEDGVYDLLYDTQTLVGGVGETIFRRRVIRVVERAGLELAAQTKIDFDPAFERLRINRVAIWRDGALLDRTAQADIATLHREDEIDRNIVTGQRTAVVRLDDVRVGDAVDIAWTWQATGSAWPGEFFSRSDMGWSVPVALTRVRLLVPAAVKPIKIRQSGGLPQPTVRRSGDMVAREWRVVDPDPIASSTTTPGWYHPWPSLTFSTMRDWGEVAAWGAAHFAGDQTLPPAFAAEVDAIAAATRDPARRATAALRLVQDRIRYTSLSIGAGGYVPRSPRVVVASGFGDCKDKSQLLAVMLRRLGIAAWPALTDSDEGAGLPRILPSAGAFDHAIVLARIAGRDTWLDATVAHQGGGDLSTLAALPYHYALPLRPGQATLVAIANPVPSVDTMRSVETYRYVEDELRLDVATRFLGDEADIKRAAIASSGIAKLERAYFDYYRDLYPGLRAVGHVAVRDDRDANRIMVRESYRLPETAKDYANTVANLHVLAGTVRATYKAIGDTDARTAPISLPWTIRRSHRIVFDMPGRTIALPLLRGSIGPAFDLTTRAWHDGGRAILDYTMVGKAQVLPADTSAAYTAQLDALDTATNWSVDTTIPGFASDGTNWPLMLLAALMIGGFVWWLVERRRVASRRAQSGPVSPDRAVFGAAGTTPSPGD